MLEVFGVMVFVVIGLSSLWVRGIVTTHEKYPDYKGKGEGFDFDDLDRPDFSHEENDLYYNTEEEI